MHLWQRIESLSSVDYRIFRIRQDLYRSPRGVEHPFVVLEAPDWVNVIALTSEQQVVMVRQFRHGVREETSEFPGGMVDADEAPLQAAQRELLEETGYAAESWDLLGWSYPNPAIQENRCWTFLARDARRRAEPALDPMESIEVRLWPVAELDMAFQRGEIGHALIQAGWLQFCLKTRTGPGE